jgi:pyruvate/2-oxoglutarate dehydrogenase complex dihydrolipoamide acyltransferase (E2) component
MPAEVKLPSLGVAIQEAKIVNLCKKVGDPVKKGETLAQVETDKVTFEIVSPVDGFVLKICHDIGEAVALNETIVVVGEKGEKYCEKLGEALVEAVNLDSNRAETRSKLQNGQGVELKSKIKATPSAKVEAKRLSIDLSELKGSGPGGLITKDDVLNAYRIKLHSSDEDFAEEEIIPFTGVRRQIAERVLKSKNENVQVTTVVEMDLTEVDTLRKMLKKTLEEKENINLTYLPFIIKASIEALKDFPILNAMLNEDRIIVKKYVNFGIAVESPNGLLVPVIHRTEKMGFWELVRSIDSIVKRAKNNTLTPEDLGGGTITISNAGSYGSILSTPIIVYPQSCLIWMGKVQDKPVYIGDEIKKRKMVYVCLSYDHRIVDWATVAQFLTKVKDILENPGSIIII